MIKKYCHQILLSLLPFLLPVSLFTFVPFIKLPKTFSDFTFISGSFILSFLMNKSSSFIFSMIYPSIVERDNLQFAFWGDLTDFLMLIELDGRTSELLMLFLGISGMLTIL